MECYDCWLAGIADKHTNQDTVVRRSRILGSPDMLPAVFASVRSAVRPNIAEVTRLCYLLEGGDAWRVRRFEWDTFEDGMLERRCGLRRSAYGVASVNTATGLDRRRPM